MESTSDRLNKWKQEESSDRSVGTEILFEIACQFDKDLKLSEEQSQARLDTIGDAMSEIDRLTRIIASRNQLLATAHHVNKDRPCAKYLIGIRRPELREYECPICEALRNDHFFTGWVVVEKHIEHAPE
jgi:hypothetical protein